MYEVPRCFLCNELGHLKAHCPKRRTSAAEAPAAPPAGGGQEEKIKFVTDANGVRRLVMDIPGWTQGPIADAAEWMSSIRSDNSQLVWDSVEAREKRARALAAEQLEEMRREREAEPETGNPSSVRPAETLVAA